MAPDIVFLLLINPPSKNKPVQKVIASLKVGRKFTVFALLYFVFEGNFQVQAPQGAYIWRGDLTEGFLRYEFGGPIFGRAYFRNFIYGDS